MEQERDVATILTINDDSGHIVSKSIDKHLIRGIGNYESEICAGFYFIPTYVGA